MGRVRAHGARSKNRKKLDRDLGKALDLRQETSASDGQVLVIDLNEGISGEVGSVFACPEKETIYAFRQFLGDCGNRAGLQHDWRGFYCLCANPLRSKRPPPAGSG